MNQQVKPKVYNDGICFIVTEKQKFTDFRAKENSTSQSDFDIDCKMMYATVSLREQDIEFAEALGRSVTFKIKTPYKQGITSDNKVIAGETLYDIVNIDIDRSNNEIYFYLEEVRKFA